MTCSSQLCHQPFQPHLSCVYLAALFDPSLHGFHSPGASCKQRAVVQVPAAAQSQRDPACIHPKGSSLAPHTSRLVASSPRRLVRPAAYPWALSVSYRIESRSWLGCAGLLSDNGWRLTATINRPAPPAPHVAVSLNERRVPSLAWVEFESSLSRPRGAPASLPRPQLPARC
jgi:hypothetical protein